MRGGGALERVGKRKGLPIRGIGQQQPLGGKQTGHRQRARQRCAPREVGAHGGSVANSGAVAKIGMLDWQNLLR